MSRLIVFIIFILIQTPWKTDAKVERPCDPLYLCDPELYGDPVFGDIFEISGKECRFRGVVMPNSLHWGRPRTLYVHPDLWDIFIKSVLGTLDAVMLERFGEAITDKPGFPKIYLIERGPAYNISKLAHTRGQQALQATQRQELINRNQ